MSNHFVPHSQIPYYTKTGENTDYCDFVPVCDEALVRAKPFVKKILEEINYNPKSKRAFTIADYGSADGGVSLDLITFMIGIVKERFGADQEIQIQYEDQATSDFNLLFRIIHGLKEKSTPSYLTKSKNVFVNACGTNFYAQCFPSETVHIGLCSTSIAWLSHRPCTLKSTTQVHCSDDETEIQAFAEVAKKDYECFLVNRAKELVPGGYLVMCNMTRESENTTENQHSQLKQPFMETEKHWKSLLDDGIITQKEFEDTTINDFIMTREEFDAPFQDSNSETYKSGLRLIKAETIFIPCPIYAKWKTIENKDHHAAREYAKSLVMQTRVWSNSSYFSGLSDSRTEEEKNKIVDLFFKRYEDDIAKAPGEHCQDFLQTYLVIRKEG